MEVKTSGRLASNPMTCESPLERIVEQRDDRTGDDQVLLDLPRHRGRRRGRPRFRPSPRPGRRRCARPRAGRWSRWRGLNGGLESCLDIRFSRGYSNMNRSCRKRRPGGPLRPARRVGRVGAGRQAGRTVRGRSEAPARGDRGGRGRLTTGGRGERSGGITPEGD